ncbi:hypothetical protein DPMN_060401 [Dreissena polymorpha]|uniref:Uncharacterized protein n=1 Tax=Dreissena polymorpha TaxID=45954 RepID=A0A9D4C562_DREPO|nr:hypothetical protein DPMN_060401 [Dreissena polymorpha]
MRRVWSGCCCAVLVVIINVYAADSACTMPLLAGTWRTSSRGTWSVPANQSFISNFKSTHDARNPIVTITCEQSNGTEYVLKYSSELFAGIVLDYYICLEIPSSHLESVSTIYIVTAFDSSSGEPFTSVPSLTCANTGYKTPQRTIMAVWENASLPDVAISLPNVIRGNYAANVTDQQSRIGNDTIITVCDDVTRIVITTNSSQTADIAFSNSGVMFALSYASVNDTTFIYTYNNDSSVDDVNTFTFVCWAITPDENNTLVYVTIFPRTCKLDQTGLSVPSVGQKLVLDPIVTCPATTPSSTDNTILIIIIVVSVIGGLIIIFLLIVLVYWLVKRQREQENMAKPVPRNIDNQKRRLITVKARRPKSSNDITKVKPTKATITSPTNRTVAVQASIWIGPIQPRTISGLKHEARPKTPPSPDKFVPFVGYIDRNLTRSKTNVDKDKKLLRTSTVIEQSEPPPKRPRVLAKRKHEPDSPRRVFVHQTPDADTKYIKHFSEEFEKLHPFPLEGNPQNYIQNPVIVDPDDKIIEPTVAKTSDEHVVVVAIEVNGTESKQPNITVTPTGNGTTEHEQKAEVNPGLNNHGLTTNSYKRASFMEQVHVVPNRTVIKQNTISTKQTFPKLTNENTSGNMNECRKNDIGVSLAQAGSIRKDQYRPIVNHRYYSPYALSLAQKEYMHQKNAWIRHKFHETLRSKKEIETMRRQENERAFEKWIREKQASMEKIRKTYKTTKKFSFKKHKKQKDTSFRSNASKHSTTEVESMVSLQSKADTELLVPHDGISMVSHPSKPETV